jgi:hypothetical protein
MIFDDYEIDNPSLDAIKYLYEIKNEKFIKQIQYILTMAIYNNNVDLCQYFIENKINYQVTRK